MLQHPPAHGVVFEPQSLIQVRAAHHAIVHINVAHPGRNLAPERHPAVSRLHHAFADYDVFRRHRHPPALFVPSALDRDAIVAGIEFAAFDQNILAGFRIAPVVIRAMTRNLHIAHRHIRAQHRMQLPHRRVLHRQPVDHHVAALIGLHKLRPQVVPFAESPVHHRNPPRGHVHQGIAVLALSWSTRVEFAASFSRPRPPGIATRLAVQRSFARDADVLLLIGVDERREVDTLRPFPTSYHRRIQLGVREKAERRPARHIQVHVAFQVNGARQKCAAFHHHPSAARLGASLNRIPNRARRVRLAVRFGAEPGHRKVPRRKLRWADSGHNRPNLVVELRGPNLRSR